MKYAVLLPVAAGVTADPAWIGEYARHAEACGFESVGAVEHAVVASGYASVYPYDASGSTAGPRFARREQRIDSIGTRPVRRRRDG